MTLPRTVPDFVDRWSAAEAARDAATLAASRDGEGWRLLSAHLSGPLPDGAPR